MWRSKFGKFVAAIAAAPSKRKARLRVEALEERLPPAAGNVTAVYQANVRTWDIVGDENPNALVLTRTLSGMVKLAGGASDGGTTTVNGRPAIEIDPRFNVRFTMRGGNDRIDLRNTGGEVRFLGDVSVDTGAGVDIIHWAGVYVGGALNVNMGSETRLNGYENFSLQSANVGSLIPNCTDFL